jgi:hypothetical protein
MPRRVTVVVGPNNSGKSLLLREIESWASGGQQPSVPWPGGELIAAISAELPSDEASLRRALESRAAPHQPSPEHMLLWSFAAEASGIGPGGGPGEVSVPVMNPWGGDFQEFCRNQVLQHFRVRLDGRQRFALADPRQVTPLDRGPSSAIMAIWRDPQKYRRVREIVLRALGRHFVVNTADLPNLSIALSETEPPPESLTSISDAAIAYQRAAQPLAQFSDGIQIYTGLVAAILSLPHTILLIDEPEAYLHPTLARRLGEDLARVARERSANLIVATHSAEFLLGCVAEEPETTIVRLTYERRVATSRVLPGEEVAGLVRDPLLRSADALSALFAHAAVICEADSDRAFYEEINRRLLEASDRVGIEDAVFLNAQNWQTIPDIAAPLRRVGIPAAMIVDLDTLIEGAGWNKVIGACGLSDAESGPLHQRRHAVGELLAAAGHVAGPGSPYKIKIDGLAALEPEPRATVEAFLAELATVGIFVVPTGELESWLPALGVTNKQRWVTDMLVRLGAKGTGTYVPPGEGDVWAFVEGVAAWTNDPQRRGLPD